MRAPGENVAMAYHARKPPGFVPEQPRGLSETLILSRDQNKYREKGRGR